MVFDRIPKAFPLSEICFSPCWPSYAVEIPQRLFCTVINIGSSWPGREAQIKQLAKSPSAVPASPPVTIEIPFALFFYFIPPLQSYGKMILNILMVLIFVPFFDAVLLFGASALMDIPIFTNFKIVVTTMAFLSINLLMTLLLLFAIIKAAFGVLNSDVGKGVKTAVKYFI